jgi:hypothetical protein
VVTIFENKFKIRAEGNIEALLLLIDFLKPESYAMIRAEKQFCLLLVDFPPYKEVYEKVLRFELL